MQKKIFKMQTYNNGPKETAVFVYGNRVLKPIYFFVYLFCCLFFYYLSVDLLNWVICLFVTVCCFIQMFKEKSLVWLTKKDTRIHCWISVSSYFFVILLNCEVFLCLPLTTFF